MKALTVSDLKQYLREHDLSPEQVAVASNISNMTIRRLLKKDGRTHIPKKYLLQLGTLIAPWAVGGEAPPFIASLLHENQGGDFKNLLSDLQKSGESVGDLGRLETDTRAKFADPNLGKTLRSQILKLLEVVTAREIGLKERALGVGALLYFINPFDLIPDAIPGVGYIDDFAIVVLVLGLIFGPQSQSKTT